MKNILISCAGRRVELVQAFREQSADMGIGSSVYATDCSPGLSPACQVADFAGELPSLDDRSYVTALKEFCDQHEIGLIIPTIDPELEELAAVREDFESSGIMAIISDPDLVAQCRDKRRTGNLFAEAGIQYPKIFDPDSAPFPCFVKPFDGSSGIGARRLDSESDLGTELRKDPRMMFMDLVPDEFCEYTIDAYFDRDSILRCAVPRKRIEVRAGEVSKGVTRRNFVFDQFIRGFSKLRGARGCVTVQVFVEERHEEILGLEINPRFGGGFPLAYSAGANYPRWIIEEYFCDGAIQDFDAWEDNLMMLRYDAKILVPDAVA